VRNTLDAGDIARGVLAGLVRVASRCAQAKAWWVAHALEQYADPGLRFRVEGAYVGDRPR
jgi:hypothetical protein